MLFVFAAISGVYNVSIETEGPHGRFTIEVHEDWAPLAAARFRELVQEGFFDGCKFFRAVTNFMVQFGIAAVPGRRHALLQDEPVTRGNARGTVSFATSGPNARATQVFVNTNDNSYLDAMGFAPFGRVVEGLDVVEGVYAGYGEAPMAHNAEMHEQGNAYLQAAFPLLSTLRRATLQPAPELQRLLARGPEDFAAGALTFVREQKRTPQERDDFLGQALAFAREHWPTQAADATAGAAVRTATAAAVPAAASAGAATTTAAVLPSLSAAVEATNQPATPSAALQGQQQALTRPRYVWTREGIAMWAKVNGPTYARAGAPRAGSVVTEPVLWGWAAAGIPAEDLEASKWIAPMAAG